MRAVALVVALAAGCAAPVVVGIDRQPGLDGSWALEEESPVLLDVTGTTATLVYRGRTFVFERIDRLRGRLAEDAVDLTGGELRIHVDPERIVIREGKTRVLRALSDLPEGGRFVLRDGDLRPS